MKKNLLTLAVAALTVASTSAVPAKRLTKTVTQPDGSTLTVTFVGDEWSHSFVTSDGLAVDFTPEGHAVYCGTDGPTSVYAHEVSERPASELSFIASESSRISYQAKRSGSPRVIARETRTGNAPGLGMSANGSRIKIEQEDSQVPHKGTANIPIILVQYTNVDFKDGDGANATFQDFFSGEGVSAYKYFQDASLGLYDPQFHVFGPFTLSKNRAYYGNNNIWGNDLRVGAMVKEAITLADPTTDFSMFDNDGDGICDVVIVLYAGVGEADTALKESVWPLQWDLRTSDVGETVTCDGVICNKFAVFNEISGTDQSQIDGIGTFCHEFSHCLGLPDFYETTYSNGYFGMSVWSLLDYGCYNDDGYTPIGYSAYEKAFMGWIDLIDGQPNTKYSLPVLNNPDDPQTTAVVLSNPQDTNEYFIFENRAKQGWDSYINDEGMMITHVTYSASAWANNTVNNSIPQRMTIVPADNKLSSATLSGDLWPKSYATEFTDESTPAAKTNTGGYLSQPVTEITRDPQTGVVSFWVDRQPVSELPAPELTDPVEEEPGSFTAVWNPVEVDGTGISYTLQVWPASDGLPVPQVWTDFSDGLSGWTVSGECKILSSSMYFGTAESEGAITSEARVTPDNGSITIVANCKIYGSDSDSEIYLSILDEDGNEAGYEIFPVDNTPRYYSVAFNGLDDNKTFSVKIGNNGRAKRVTLYSAMAFPGYCMDADDIDYENAFAGVSGGNPAPARVEQTTEGDRTTISGITGTSYKVTGLTPAATYRFHVKAVPADPEKALESLWSETKEIVLSANSGIVQVTDEMAGATFHVINGEIVASPGARLYSVSGTEVKPVAPGRFTPLPGAYILVIPGLRPAKIVL